MHAANFQHPARRYAIVCSPHKMRKAVCGNPGIPTHRLVKRFFLGVLPDYNLVFGSAVEFVTLLDAEGVEEGNDVAQGNVHALLGQRVNVADS